MTLECRLHCAPIVGSDFRILNFVVPVESAMRDEVARRGLFEHFGEVNLVQLVPFRQISAFQKLRIC